MKKILIFILLLIAFPRFTYASSSITVIDTDSNRVLYSSNQHEKKLIASITKIMTCIIAIESGKLEDTVTIDDSILESTGSNIYLSVGEKIKLKDLLYGLMLRSGNDAAIAISNYISDNFVDLMNKKAQEIGMKNTVFANPHGLDNKNKNYSTSYDMAILSSYAIKNKTYKEIVGSIKYTAISDTKTYIWGNKNKLLKIYKFATGGKLARRTLVSNATKNNINLSIVTLNVGDDFNLHQSLYEEYFSMYTKYRILNKSKIYIDNNEKYYIKNDFYYLLDDNEKDEVKLNTIINTKKKNGYIKVLLDNKEIHREKIYYDKMRKISFWKRLFS